MLLINQQRFAYCAALFLLVLSSIYTIPNSYAGSIDDLIIDLEVGQWDRKQTTFVNGKGVPQLSFVGANCRSEQEPDLTLRDYTNKVIRNLGSETDCDVSNLVDTKTKVSFDMRCTASDTQLVTLLDVNYRISRERMRLKAQGSIEHKNGSTPIKVTAESRWLGPCNDAIPEMEDQRLIGANQPYNLQNAIDANSSVASSIATKKRVKSIKPSRLSIYLKSRKSNKPLVVHYSSTDPNCTHCIKDNKSIEQAYETLEEKFDFVQVVFNPWQSFTKKYRRLGGLPTTEIFDGVVPESMIKGFQADMASNITHVHKETQELLADDYDDVELLTITSNDLQGLVNQGRGSKVLFVHLSSKNADACPFCVKSNPFFRAAAREFSDQYDFAEIEYDQLSDLKSDSVLSDYLKAKKISVGGLPVVLFFGEKEQINQRRGVWHTILKDLKAQTAKP